MRRQKLHLVRRIKTMQYSTLLKWTVAHCHVLCTSAVELYKNFNALPPLKLHELQIFMLLYKFFHHSDKLPIHVVFRDYFTLNRSVHSHSTRNCNSLHVSSVQSPFGKRAVKFKGPMLWNNLPAPLREPMSVNKFRKLIKLYLTTDSENWIFSCVYTMLRYCIV